MTGQPITISAALRYDWTTNSPHPVAVDVYIGDTRIASMPPAAISRAGHGDDSKYFEAEDQRVITTTVAPVLARMFADTMATMAAEADGATIYVQRTHRPDDDDIYGPFATREAARERMELLDLNPAGWQIVDRAAE